MTPGAAVPFSESSLIRRVHSENIVLLGGGRALLLQVAHPAVAAGVAEHSSFRQGRSDRLLHTLRPTLAMVFGDGEQAATAAGSINAVHANVTGAGYSALDPELLFWVLATLIDTALEMHARFLRPLSADDAQAYYDDMLTAGGMLGVRRAEAPPTLTEFRDYMTTALERLEVTSTAREIGRDLFAADLPLRPLFTGLRDFSAWLLPERLRHEYGFTVGRGESLLFEAGARAARLVLPHLPRRLRAPPRFLLPSTHADQQWFIRQEWARNSRKAGA